jgi:hypothetical protein
MKSLRAGCPSSWRCLKGPLGFAKPREIATPDVCPDQLALTERPPGLQNLEGIATPDVFPEEIGRFWPAVPERPPGLQNPEGCLRGFPHSGTSSPEATSVAAFAIIVAEGWKLCTRIHLTARQSGDVRGPLAEWLLASEAKSGHEEHRRVECLELDGCRAVSMTTKKEQTP